MKFRPYQVANAIVRVGFVCEFAQPLGDERLRAFEAAHAQFGDQFPKLNIGQGLNLQIGIGGAPVPVAGLAAVAYQDYDRAGELLRSFQAQQQTFGFVHNRYTRWSDIWSQARDVVSKAFAVVPHAQIQAFGLDYVDKFTAPAEGAAPDVTGLFRRETRYLVPRIFDIGGIWHSHHGSLEEDVQEPRRHSKNDNINVDLVRERVRSDQFAVNIVLRHRRVLAQTVLASAALHHFDFFMDEMHRADKVVIRDLLTDEAAQEINLEPNDGSN